MAENVYDLWSGNNGLRNDTQPILFTNARILDATGESTYTGEVEISGNRIKSINKQGVGSYNWNSNGTQRIDCRGMTLMPGLIDAHLHLSWNNAAGVEPINMMPIEEHTLVCVEMAKLLLDSGFTAGRGAAAAKPRLDLSLIHI